MSEQFIKIVRKNGSSLAINLPKEVVELLNIKDQDIVRVSLEKVDRKRGDKQ